VLLRSGIFTSEQLQAIARDYRHAGLEPAEVAMMAVAEKIAADANRVSADDIDALRRHGSPTPRSWTTRWRRPPAASSARSWTASAPPPTMPS